MIKKFFLTIALVFLTGYLNFSFAGVTIDLRGETWHIMDMTYDVGGKVETIVFDPQAYNPSYRLKGKNEIIIKDFYISESGKEKICTCKDAKFKRKRKENITIKYNGGKEGDNVYVNGYYNKEKVDITCPCVKGSKK